MFVLCRVWVFSDVVWSMGVLDDDLWGKLQVV